MSEFITIDAHVHLWNAQNGRVNGGPVAGVGNGKANFDGEIRQMMPPYMTDNENTAERLLANMDYAGVNGCVVTQEYIDGNQDEYLKCVRKKYPDRFRVCALYEDTGNCTGNAKGLRENLSLDGFDGVKVCASRLQNPDVIALLPLFLKAEDEGKFISVDLADGALQVDGMRELIRICPKLRIAIGHFGMVTTEGWQKQIELAQNPNVYIESGGLTWLFHKEFYPYAGGVDAICEAKEICGAEKLMWGSDYPRTMTDITYSMATRFILETPKLTRAEKAAFLGGNAQKFYGFDFSAPLPAIGNMLD